MALMAAKGEIGPMPVAAIFADTQAEPAGVYKWLEYLKAELPFPVITVSAGSLEEASVRVRTAKESGNRYLAPGMPVFVVNKGGKPGIWSRQCTRHFKIDVVRRRSRALAREHGTKRIVQWMGISLDEAHRMKDSLKKDFDNRYPLIDLRMSRAACLQWMERNGYPRPPKSSCVFCPYKGDRQWKDMKANDPAGFDRAVQYEKRLSEAMRQITNSVDGAFIHRSMRPLREVDFDAGSAQLDMFGNECEGACGL
jgi:hypothetical protein